MLLCHRSAMKNALNLDLEKLLAQAFHRAEWAEAVVRRYHAAPKLISRNLCEIFQCHRQPNQTPLTHLFHLKQVTQLHPLNSKTSVKSVKPFQNQGFSPVSGAGLA